MEYSLLKEINKKNLQAYLIARVYEKLFWPTFFPLKATPFLSYETLVGSKGNRVAADVVAYDTSAPLKTRRTVSKLSGEIPSIRMKKVMTESDLNKYNIFKAQAEPDQKALLDLVFGDVDDCVDGVNARLEWIIFQALSKGTITLSSVTNAAGVVTEEDIDFQLPLTNKIVSLLKWDTAERAATPISDIEAVVAAAKALGIKPRYILMNESKWFDFRKTKEVQDFVIPFALYGGVKVKRAPSLDVANQALKSEGLPTIIKIDTRISLEDANHTITSVDPWLDASEADAANKDRYVTFLEDLKCGDMLHGPIAEETNPPKQVVQAKKGPTLISKWSDVDPVAEYTKGELNAFPSWPTIDRVIILDTKSEKAEEWGA